MSLFGRRKPQTSNNWLIFTASSSWCRLWLLQCILRRAFVMYFTAAAQRQPLNLDADRKRGTLRNWLTLHSTLHPLCPHHRDMRALWHSSEASFCCFSWVNTAQCYSLWTPPAHKHTRAHTCRRKAVNEWPAVILVQPSLLEVKYLTVAVKYPTSNWLHHSLKLPAIVS